MNVKSYRYLTSGTKLYCIMRIIWDNPEFVKQILLPWYLMGGGGNNQSSNYSDSLCKKHKYTEKISSCSFNAGFALSPNICH